MSAAAQLSIIIPTLNEAAGLGALLSDIAALPCAVEIIVVDGGSSDDTVALATPLVDRVLQCPAGRAAQMNAGAAQASGRILWFVHADSRLSAAAGDYVAALTCGAGWGFFRVALDGRQPVYRVIERAINLRSRLTGIGTGDQGIFADAGWFRAQGEFADLPLMEDVELCKRLRRLKKPHVARAALQTSSRRWQRNGVLPTVLLMWRLRLWYFLGVDPQRLAAAYRRSRGGEGPGRMPVAGSG